MVLDLKDHDAYFSEDYHTVVCDRCWDNYPQECTCGGMIHADWGDYTADGSYYLDKACTACGSEYDSIED